eukprot:Transcript_5052.p1 GENE.Transcript_5052~~Transcript_5052.p1  ORF type:complete len:437 (-),score=67.85 Transcript_5052:51-1319(-)
MSCDACRHAPPASRTQCALPEGDGCAIRRCQWVEQLPRTFGIQFGPGARGWGNSYTYVRNLHEVAALLGRRLLLHPVRSYLPAEHLLLGSKSWVIPDSEFAQHMASAHIVLETQAAAALGIQKFVRENRTTYRALLLKYLGQFADQQHLWFNVSNSGRGAHYILSKFTPCPRVRHAPAFLQCLGKLMTTPSPALESQLRPIRARLNSRPHYHGIAGVHIRTAGADMGLTKGTTPDPQRLLQFQAWEAQVNESTYTAAVLKLCSKVERRNLTLYVASDSRSAVGMFERLCPGVEHLGASYTTRVHLEKLRRHSDKSQASASLLDWVILSEAKLLIRWGALQSSFIGSAALRGCSPSWGRSPKEFKYAAAGLWLIQKVRAAHHRHRHNATYDCNSGALASMIMTTPCETPCLTQCVRTIESAYA